ncbi:zinc ABC transporter substrate-binding protein, partial [Pelagibacteraceae bacterium]|nr:zinc ABC transporter substrate-binding protein [Pelagibacteraceae bacterium]
FDAHIWLDPSNAKEMVHEIAHELGDLDPANKDKYEANAKATIKALDQLISDVGTDINSEAKFVVFHDAYQYFEERFGVRAAGALTLNTDVLPGAKQIADIQDVIKDKGIKCIFSEPQFNPKIITTIAEDMNIKTGVFDPLGANIDPGKSLYFKLISNLGNELKGC